MKKFDKKTEKQFKRLQKKCGITTEVVDAKELGFKQNSDGTYSIELNINDCITKITDSEGNDITDKFQVTEK